MFEALRKQFRGVAMASKGRFLNPSDRIIPKMEKLGWEFEHVHNRPSDPKGYLIGPAGDAFRGSFAYIGVCIASKGNARYGDREWYRDLAKAKGYKREQLPQWMRRRMLDPK